MFNFLNGIRHNKFKSGIHHNSKILLMEKLRVELVI